MPDRRHRPRNTLVFIEMYADQFDSIGTDFLIKLNKSCPITIGKLLTDNGSQFTDRFTSKKKIRKRATGFQQQARV